MNVQKLLPHRPPFLFVDKIELLEGNKIVTTKFFTGEEDFYSGHFPGTPITPGVLMMEGLLQTGALYMSASLPEVQSSDNIRTPVVTRIKEVKFRNMALPPIHLSYEVLMDEVMGGVTFFKGKVTSDGKTLVTAEFACTLLDKTP